MLERMLALLPGRDAPDAAEYAEQRRTLVQRIAAATADKLGDPKGAFRWWRRAHDEAPDEQTLADVRRAGEAYGLWRELAEVLTDERKRLVAAGADGVPVGARAVRRAVARARGRCASAGSATSRARWRCSPRRSRSRRATARCSPSSSGSRPRSISGRSGSALLDAYDVALDAAAPPPSASSSTCGARKILDERMNDPKGAVADVLAAFSWAPDREDVRDVAGRARRQGARVERGRRGRQRARSSARRRRRGASSCCAARRR